jgi:hypothetical protein
MSDSFQLADRKLGGGLLYEQVMRYIQSEISPRLLDPPRDCSHGELFSAAASFAEVAGWMAHDGGNDDKAKGHFGQAYHLATAAENPILSANVCASLSHLAVQIGQSEDAVRIATVGAQRVSRQDGAQHLAARLHAMRARAIAMQGDEKASRFALDSAHDELSRRYDCPQIGWIAGFDEASLAGESALCLYSLGRSNEAESEARKVIALRSVDRVRSRSLAQLTLANILQDAGNLEEAAAIGANVCVIAPTLNSVRVHSGLAKLGEKLARRRSVLEVSNFLDSLNQLNGKSTRIRESNGWPL